MGIAIGEEASDDTIFSPTPLGNPSENDTFKLSVKLSVVVRGIKGDTDDDDDDGQYTVLYWVHNSCSFSSTAL